MAERNQRLELTVPSGSGWAQAGYVTKVSHSMDDLTVEVDVAEYNSLSQMDLMISLTKTTDSDPHSELNWYMISKVGIFGWNRLYVQRKKDGKLTMLTDIPWEGPTGKLKISVSDGVIRFYENGVFKFAEDYKLTSYNCYIYVYTSTEKSHNSGTDAFDDIEYFYNIAPLYFDDFNDGNYNGWTVYSGSWSVTSGRLRGQDGIIYTDEDFPKDRCVESELYTYRAGPNNFDVAVLIIKWASISNQITTRVFKNGDIELIMWENDRIAHQTIVHSSLSPYSWHTIRAVVSGTNIKVFIDETKYIDVNDAHFDDIDGSVGYQVSGSQSTAYFDNMKVTW